MKKSWFWVVGGLGLGTWQVFLENWQHLPLILLEVLLQEGPQDCLLPIDKHENSHVLALPTRQNPTQIQKRPHPTGKNKKKLPTRKQELFVISWPASWLPQDQGGRPPSAIVPDVCLLDQQKGERAGGPCPPL